MNRFLKPFLSIFVIRPSNYRKIHTAFRSDSNPFKTPIMASPSDPRIFTLLIAEDNPVNMTLNRIIIRNMFPNVLILEAENGKDAVELAASVMLDIILMDIMMPVMDGYEATLLIRQQETNKHTPIIALTASIMPDEMQKCLSVGFNDSISKPIIRENFYRIVLKWLDKN